MMMKQPAAACVPATASFRHAVHVGGIALALATALYISACDGGGGGGNFSGASTLRGTVAVYETSQGAWLPCPAPTAWIRVVRATGECLVPNALAGVGGVTVEVVGTDLSATTAEDGLFIISGVPPGSRDVVFRLGADSATLTTEVPPNSTVELSDVRIRNDRVDVDRVAVTVHAPPPDEDATSGTNSGPGGGEEGPADSNSGSGGGDDHATPDDPDAPDDPDDDSMTDEDGPSQDDVSEEEDGA